MKNYLSKANGILAVLFVLCMYTGTKPAAAQVRTTASIQVFYDELEPYGDWIYDHQYGYVWVPDGGPDFQPYYSNGYWEMTEYGNTWVSMYSWGWAPFHYGRWTYDSYYGWVWIPGYVWAPAWVCWRHGGGYFGWAPLSPYFTITIGFGVYDCPPNWWIFAPAHHLYGPHHGSHYIHHNTDIVRHTSIVNHTRSEPHSNVLYPVGPIAEEVRAATGSEVKIRRIEAVTRPRDIRVEENSIHLYRPDIEFKGSEEKQPEPGRINRRSVPLGNPQPIRSSGDIRPEGVKNPVLRAEPRRESVQPQKEREPEPVRRSGNDETRPPKPSPRVVNPPARVAPVQKTRINTVPPKRR